MTSRKDPWAEFLERVDQRRGIRSIPADLGQHARVIIAATSVGEPSLIVWLAWSAPGEPMKGKLREIDVCFTLEEARESAADVMMCFGVSELVDYTLPDGDWPPVSPWCPKGGG